MVQNNDYLSMGDNAYLFNPSERPDFLEFELNGVSGANNSVSGASPTGVDSEAYFVMKAPTTRVELMGGQVHGAIVANIIDVGVSSNCTVVYDLDLPSNTSSPVLPGGTGEVNIFVVSYQIF